MDIGAQSNFSQVQSFADMQQFTSLRAQARENPEATAAEVASQFESIFVQMMMSSMRKASEPLESGLFSSNQSKMYEKIMDQQLSMNISAQGGLGLAELIERQIAPQAQTANTGSEDITKSNQPFVLRRSHQAG